MSASSRPRRAAAARLGTYSESTIDTVLLSHLGASPPRRRGRKRSTTDRQKETDVEAMVAVSLGFPIDVPLPAERDVLPPAAAASSANEYLVVRNHILASWRADVRSPLPRAAVLHRIAGRYDSLVSVAHGFLSREGHINFGVGPSFPARGDEMFGSQQPLGSVVVIGAGLAGLAAARQLMRFGFKVLVLEGRGRPGGRVHTWTVDGKTVELGGSVITGIHANPLGVLAKQLGAPLHKVRDRCPLFQPDGHEVDPALDGEVDLAFNRLLDQASQVRKVPGVADGVSLGDAIEKIRKLYCVARDKEERELLDWHFANLEYANAGCLSDLSLAEWDQDDPYEMSGDHCLLAGGNGRLVKALAEGVPVLYKKAVTRIEYGDRGVSVVVAGGQVFHADMALCTVPLGVLKRESICFDPELPEQKRDAINRLGFGLLNKVAMVFPFVFWDEDLDTFGYLNGHKRKRGQFFLFYSYHTVSGGAVLIALVAGEAALAFESIDPVVSLHHVLGVLRGIYGRKGVTVPDPIQSVCTRWGSDPFSSGSYSHVRVGSSGHDYDILAESIMGRLFFAGEATIRKYPATMHGALLSGLREAACVLHAAESRASLHSGPRKPLPRSLPNKGDTLSDLFKEPDVAAGNFSFVFSPLTEDDPKALGLVRVSFGNHLKLANGNCASAKEEPDDRRPKLEVQSQRFFLYGILSRDQAHEMQLANGDDRTTLTLFCKKFCLKLMGYDNVCALAHYLIGNIVSARKCQSRLSQPKNHRTLR